MAENIPGIIDSSNNYEKVAVYVIYNYDTNLTKIGISDKPQRRIRQIHLSSGCNIVFLEFNYLSYSCKLKAEEIEKKLHKKYAKYRIVGEWFKLDEKKQIQLCIDLIELTEPI